MEKQRRVIALGFFDGVHLGHGALLRQVKETADRLEAIPAAFTFDKSPAAALTGREVPLLTTVEERTGLMNQLYGIQEVVIASFDAMRSMDWEDFITGYLAEKLGVVHIVAGHDFHFGCMGKGNPERLLSKCRELGIGCDIIPKVEREGIVISSTCIRSLIARGELERAAGFLGHPHRLTGEVGHGQHLGSRLGFPTVNLNIPQGVIVPAFGVYAARVRVLPVCPDNHESSSARLLPEEGPYMAVTNVGVRPTVADSGRTTVESFLLDYSGDLYGRRIQVEFYQYLRPERKFPSVEALAQEIEKNTRQTRAFFQGG